MVTEMMETERGLGYVIFTRPFELNIVGERNKNATANSFDDKMHVYYKNDDDKWEYHVFACTTDPGTYWLNNPAMEKGTAILAKGQYRDCYAIGPHAGKYEALRQVKPVTVIRDYDRNSILDFDGAKTERGIFGINIHRAEATGKTRFINKYSAGCQVFQDAADFTKFMALCHEHKKRYGNAFTYTLLA